MTARTPRTQGIELVPESGIRAEVGPPSVQYGSETLPIAASISPSADYRAALIALVNLFRSATEAGEVELVARAEQAVVALMGEQKYLRADREDASPRDPSPSATFRRAEEHTLCGLGPAPVLRPQERATRKR